MNYGMMSGEPCHMSAGLLIFKDVSVKGFWLAKWFQQATPAEQQKLYGELTGLIVAGKLRAPVHQTYSVKDIKQAVATAAQGERNGKVIVTA